MCSFQLDKKSSLIKSNSKEVLIGILILRIKFKIRKMCLSPILKQPQVVIRFLWFHALTLMPGSVLDNLFGTEQNSVSWMISRYVVKTRGLLFKFHSKFTEMSVTEPPNSLFPGDSPLALGRTPRVKLMHCFLCSHCFCQGCSPAVPSLEIQPFSCPRAHTTSQPCPTRFLNALGSFQRQATRDGLREAEQTDTTKGHALKMRWPGG